MHRERLYVVTNPLWFVLLIILSLSQVIACSDAGRMDTPSGSIQGKVSIGVVQGGEVVAYQYAQAKAGKEVARVPVEEGSLPASPKRTLDHLVAPPATGYAVTTATGAYLSGGNQCGGNQCGGNQCGGNQCGGNQCGGNQCGGNQS